MLIKRRKLESSKKELEIHKTTTNQSSVNVVSNVKNDAAKKLDELKKARFSAASFLDFGKGKNGLRI